MVDEYHLDLSSVIAVDGPGRVEDRDAMPEGKARTWADLYLIALRYLWINPSRNCKEAARINNSREAGSCFYISSGGSFCTVYGARGPFIQLKLYDHFFSLVSSG